MEIVKYSSEEKVVKLLRDMFGDEFRYSRNVRPNMIKNPITGKNLEVDIWIKQWKIAIEVNGHTSHYVDSYQRTKDKIKRQKLKKRGFTIITLWRDFLMLPSDAAKTELMHRMCASKYKAEIFDAKRNNERAIIRQRALALEVDQMDNAYFR